MAIANIPEIISDYNLYLNGRKLIGTTGEVSLPDLEIMSETISGPGILGEYETGAPGRFGSMEQEIPFRVLSADVFKLIEVDRPLELVLRAAQQFTSGLTGALDQMGMRIVFRGRCKSLVPGTVKQGGMMESSIKIELTYYMVELSGERKIELDKLNGVYVVNGRDLLAKIRSLC